MKLKFLFRRTFSREAYDSKIPLVYTPPFWDKNNKSEEIIKECMILVTGLPGDLGYWKVYKPKKL